MPAVTFKTGVIAPDGREETITEYVRLAGLPDVAEHLVGVVRELGLAAAVCAQHAVFLNLAPGTRPE